jgi:hypothetical protein
MVKAGGVGCDRYSQCGFTSAGYGGNPGTGFGPNGVMVERGAGGVENGQVTVTFTAA